MHFCIHEVMLVLAAVPVLRWAVYLAIRVTQAGETPCGECEEEK